MFFLFFFAQFFWEVKLISWLSDEESNEERLLTYGETNGNKRFVEVS